MHKTLEYKLAGTKKIQLVFISGLAGSGKTTAAQYLAYKLNSEFGGPMFSSVIAPLASEIKAIATKYFGWDGKKDIKGRRLLQVIGTDAGRSYDENIWARSLLHNIEESFPLPNFVFIDDWRFPNECGFFSSLDSLLYEITKIRINRNSIDTTSPEYSHESETSLPASNEDSYYDFVIDNNGSFDDFYSGLDNILVHFRNKIIYR